MIITMYIIQKIKQVIRQSYQNTIKSNQIYKNYQPFSSSFQIQQYHFNIIKIQISILEKLMLRENQPSKRKKYMKIPYSIRVQVIQSIVHENHSIADMAEKFNLKTTTVRAIIDTYKKKGKIFEKKNEKMIRQTHQSLEQEKKQQITLNKKSIEFQKYWNSSLNYCVNQYNQGICRCPTLYMPTR